jgi:signal transduction histidine kinase
MQPGPPLSTTITWALQFALSVGVALGAAGLALTFRRPAMRLLVASSTLGAVASAFIWASLGVFALGLPGAAGPIISFAVFPISPWLIALVHLQLIRVVANRTSRTWPSPRIVLGVVAGSLLLGSALLRASLDGSPALIAAGASVGAALSHAALSAIALRWRASPGASRDALRLIGIAFALLAMRSVVNVAVAGAAAARITAPEYGIGFTVFLTGLYVIASVLLFVAVLEDERLAIEVNAERLRTAEASRASSARLESLGRMAGAVAHDFNNLLSVISLTAISAREAGSAQQRDDLTEIDGAARRGQELTRQLLAFARQAPQQVAPFDAAAQLHKLHDLLRRLAGKHATVAVELPAQPLLVEMDATQFDQVVINLVVNARDASGPDAAITVDLAEVEEQSPGPSPRAPRAAPAAAARWAVLRVTDNGPGIAPDVLPHIFEPFFTTRKAGEGTGLGLATCDGIVSRLGGRIDVRTAPGQGTTMSVFIPVAAAH